MSCAPCRRPWVVFGLTAKQLHEGAAEEFQLWKLAVNLKQQMAVLNCEDGRAALAAAALAFRAGGYDRRFLLLVWYSWLQGRSSKFLFGNIESKLPDSSKTVFGFPSSPRVR